MNHHFVKIKTFDSITLAEFAKNLLRAEGVTSMVRRGALHYSIGDKAGAELWVREKDFQRAKEILNAQDSN